MRTCSVHAYSSVDHIVANVIFRDEAVVIACRFGHVAIIATESDRSIYDARDPGLTMAASEFVDSNRNRDDTWPHAAALTIA